MTEELTKCYEPLQTLRVRLWPCKIDLSPPLNFVLLIVPSRYFCGVSFRFMSWCLTFFVLLAPYVCFQIFSSVKVTEWPPIGKIAAHSAYEMFSWYKYLVVSLFFSHFGFWSGSLFF